MPYTGTPETETPDRLVVMRAANVELGTDGEPSAITVVMTRPVQQWIADRLAATDGVTFEGPDDGITARLPASTAWRLSSEAGSTLPVSHESHAIYACLNDIANRLTGGDSDW